MLYKYEVYGNVGITHQWLQMSVLSELLCLLFISLCSFIYGQLIAILAGSVHFLVATALTTVQPPPRYPLQVAHSMENLKTR